MNYLRSFDRSVIAVIDKLPRNLSSIMRGVSFVASPMPVIGMFAVAMALTYLMKNPRLLVSEGMILMLIPLGGIIKLLTRRLRRDTIYVKGLKYKTFSFPSGHAYGSLLMFGSLAFLCLNSISGLGGMLLAAFLVALILLVGISRVYLGAHYPSDVLGGWLIGGFVLLKALSFIMKS